MSRTLVIAKYTVLELVKGKILLASLLLGLGIVFISFLPSSLAYGTPEKVALDIGMGILSLSSVGIAIFLGSSLVSTEIENRTVYIILTRPVSRSSFILGKIWGLLVVLVLNGLILSSLTLGFYLFFSGNYSPLILWNVFFTLLESAFCLMIVVFFSLVTNKIAAVIWSLALYFLGHTLPATLEINSVKNNPLLYKVLEVTSSIVPNFSKINIKDFLIYKETLEPSFLWGASAYALVYIAFIALGATLIFQKKDLN